MSKQITLSYFSDLYDKGLSVPEMAENLSNYTGNKITINDVRDIATAYAFDLRKKKRTTTVKKNKEAKYTLEDINSTTTNEESFTTAPNSVVVGE